MDNDTKYSAKVLLIILVVIAICIGPYIAWQNHNTKTDNQKLEKSGTKISTTAKSSIEQAVIDEASQKGVKAGIQVQVAILHYDGSEVMGVISYESSEYSPKQFIADLQNGKWVVTQYASKVSY